MRAGLLRYAVEVCGVESAPNRFGDRVIPDGAADALRVGGSVDDPSLLQTGGGRVLVVASVSRGLVRRAAVRGLTGRERDANGFVATENVYRFQFRWSDDIETALRGGAILRWGARDWSPIKYFDPDGRRRELLVFAKT